MTSSRSLVDSSDLVKSLEAGDVLGDLKSLDQLKNTKTADLDLPNILVAYLIPLPLDRLRKDYEQAQQNVHTWQAWEAAKTEGWIAEKIKSGDLPSDNSYESKLKRTLYRAQVIESLRKTSSWLTAISSENGGASPEVPKSEASTAVLSALSTLLPVSFAEVDILLRPISRGILEGRASVDQYLFTFVTHPYDIVQHTVLTTVDSLSVSITTKDGSAKDQVKIEIVWKNIGRSFNHHQWLKVVGKIEKPIIEAGENILKKKSLHLTLPSSL